VKLKLDENLGTSIAHVLEAAQHDVETVASQNLEGCDDVRLFEICRVEERCLVTLDKEFGNPLLHDPSRTSGIALIRLPARGGKGELQAAAGVLRDALSLLESDQRLRGRLWIVQPDRIREYNPQKDDEVQ
jgi:Domain of unknown function (DUF5615)